jgi:hypothetical protein
VGGSIFTGNVGQISTGIYIIVNDPNVTQAVFYAGDDKDAKAMVAELITKMGFDAVDAVR